MKKILLFLCLIITLTGCVRYDVGITFPQANSGTIIQHIKLGEQLTSFSDGEGNAWLNSIERQALKLQGKTKRLSKEELVVTIPFNNAQELVDKFNLFFVPQLSKKSQQNLAKNNSSNLLELEAKMSIKQNNLILLVRNTLNFYADLRPLGVIANDGTIIISSGDLIDLQIQFTFPWGAKLSQENEFPKKEKITNNQYNLQLEAGQINAITAIFWLPNYVGLGTVAIALFILLGYYLKYKKLPLIS
ncbi:DUF3153 domain-containing protein [Geminocystis sp. GBBB08]|uniref:DUF3153 domain-containing protein n=1 Tax=Geminocystis sp. GBBB08 TaxID=2604140 RepID=UPI0027E2BFD1|nr:DUF3153 domain-containing protein [Geminocystis sp. GBBB08]MBL1210949.1 DUF3153 domain-containing protein [Geminocystis sp. GBBB08]